MQFYKTKLNIHLKPVVIALVLLLQVHAIVTAVSLNNAINTRINNYLEESARLASEIITQRVVQVATSLATLAKTVETQWDATDANTESTALLDRYKTAFNFHSLVLLTPEEVAGPPGASIDTILRERKLAQRAIATKKLALGKCSHVEGVAYAIPIIHDGEVVAVLIADRGVEKTTSLLDIRVFSSAGLIMLVDHDNNVLVKNWKDSTEEMRSHISFISSQNKLIPSSLGSDYDLRENMQSSFKDSHGHTWLFAQYAHKEYGASLIYAAPDHVLMENMPSLRWWNIAMHVVSFLFILLLIGELLWLQKAYTKKLEEEQFHDKLTGGDNSAAFAQKMGELLANTTDAYALITLDINKFKLINDGHGIDKANELLRLIYAVLESRLKNGELPNFQPTVYMFGAKSAPGYARAKAIIRYINRIAKMINNDPYVNDKMKVVFVQNYNCSYAEHIIPAADISEQISPAGLEASGTGNMKLMLNGAVTLGTLDGANVEIAEEAGRENEYIFGATVEQINAIKGSYNARNIYLNNPDLKRALDTLVNGTVETDLGMYNLFKQLVEGGNDQYYLLLDYASYVEAKLQANREYADRMAFGRKCMMNVASAAKFSSDRTIRQYAEEIWHIKPTQF